MPALVPRIDYAVYRPGGAVEDYGPWEVTRSGSVVPRPKLSPKLIELLTSTLRVDVGLWNGERGACGIPYVTTERRSTSMSLVEVKQCRNIYRGLIAARTNPQRESILQRELGMHTRISGQLETLSTQLKRKINSLQATFYTRPAETGMSPIGSSDSTDGSPRSDSAEVPQGLSALYELRNELQSVQATLERSLAKKKAALEELEEAQTARERQDAILERVFFADDVRDILLWGAPLSQLENYNIMLSITTSRDGLFSHHERVKRAHIDAKKGIVHLFALEGLLKGILEHLREAMNAETARPALSTSSNPTPQLHISASQRIAQARKLHRDASAVFNDVLRYAPFTALGVAPNPAASRNAPATSANGDWSSPASASELRGVSRVVTSPTARRQTFLANFERIAAAPALRTRDRIAKLHSLAAGAYRTINDAYDLQLRVVLRTCADLNAAADGLAAAQRDLRAARERIFLCMR